MAERNIIDELIAACGEVVDDGNRATVLRLYLLAEEWFFADGVAVSVKRETDDDGSEREDEPHLVLLGQAVETVGRTSGNEYRIWDCLGRIYREAGINRPTIHGELT